MVEKILETATLNVKELQLNLETINLIVFIKQLLKNIKIFLKKNKSLLNLKKKNYILVQIHFI